MKTSKYFSINQRQKHIAIAIIERLTKSKSEWMKFCKKKCLLMIVKKQLRAGLRKAQAATKNPFTFYSSTNIKAAVFLLCRIICLKVQETRKKKCFIYKDALFRCSEEDAEIRHREST